MVSMLSLVSDTLATAISIMERLATLRLFNDAAREIGNENCCSWAAAHKASIRSVPQADVFDLFHALGDAVPDGDLFHWRMISFLNPPD